MNDEEAEVNWSIWHAARLIELKGMTHLTADGYPIVQDGWYWDNDLKPVQITEVAHSFYDKYPLGDRETTQVWHSHTRGQSDSLLERHDIGRLAKYYNGRPAHHEMPISIEDREAQAHYDDMNPPLDEPEGYGS